MEIEKYINQKTSEILTENNFESLYLYQMVEIVKKLTCDFDILALSLFRREVAYSLCEKYYFETSKKEINNIKVTKKDTKLDLEHFAIKFTHIPDNYEKISFFDGLFYDYSTGSEFKIYDLTSIIEFIEFAYENYQVSDYGSNLLEFAKVVDAKYRELKPANYDFRNYGFSDYYLKERNTKPSKKELTFIGLFKDEYIGRIELFYNRLIANGYIDTKHIWRQSKENEPAKVYYWLFEKGVLKYNTPTPALICFCKKFGITAYKDTEPRPTAEIRAVTVKNLLNATLTKDERKHFENVFSPFLIK